MSAEAELEAGIWTALAAGTVTCQDAPSLVRTLMQVAQLYAAGDSAALTEFRRFVAGREVAASSADRKAARKARAQEGTR